MCSLFLLIASTLYLVFRIYYQKKYLSKDWMKEYGGNEENPNVNVSSIKNTARLDESNIGAA